MNLEFVQKVKILLQCMSQELRLIRTLFKLKLIHAAAVDFFLKNNFYLMNLLMLQTNKKKPEISSRHRQKITFVFTSCIRNILLTLMSFDTNEMLFLPTGSPQNGMHTCFYLLLSATMTGV